MTGAPRPAADGVALLAQVLAGTAAERSADAGPRWLPVRTGSVGTWCLHVPTGRVVWDRASARMHGARDGEDPRDTWQRVVGAGDRQRVAGAFDHAQDRVLTFRVAPGGSADRYLLSRVTHVMTGDAVGWIAGVTLDVTASRDAAVRAEAVLESTAEGFFCLDAALRFTYVNRRAAAGLGRSYEDLLARTWAEVSPALVDDGGLEVCAGVLATGEPATFERRHPRSGGWREFSLTSADGGLHVMVRDVTARHTADAEQRRLVSQLAHQASHDALTGLANRTDLLGQLSRHLARGDGASATVLFLDLDRFKLVNDTLGHSAGDELLRVVARRLTALAGADPLVARIGGDEFVLALLDAPPAAAEDVAAAVLRALAEPVHVQGQELHVSASIGLARGGAGTDVGTLLRDADLALYRAKGAGRDQAAWYDERLHADVVRRVALERDLRAALDDSDQLGLHYQPSYSLSSGLPTGVEGLLRWQHPTRGALPPSEVIPVAEDSGLVLPLGDRVITAAAAQAVAWAAVPDLTTWVNASPRQLVAGDLVRTLARELDRTGLDPRRLGVEVTESVLVERSRAVEVLRQVRDLGVRLAIDDFGTGYSSLSRLAGFPVDVVKIDRSFLTAATASAAGAVVLDGIITVVHGIGATVIAEGVETWEQLDLLRAGACDAVSGYLLARPAPAHLTPLGRARLVAPDAEGRARQPRAASAAS